MANDYARVTRSIWTNDDFQALPQAAQWLYFRLLTSPTITYAGVTDWRPVRIAATSEGLDANAVEAASVELEQHLFTLVDRTTEEALIRTYIRHDGMMRQPNMMAVLARAYASITSKPLRGVVVHELQRLRESDPTLRGWKNPRVQELLTRPCVAPADARAQMPPYLFGLPKPSGRPCRAPAEPVAAESAITDEQEHQL